MGNLTLVTSTFNQSVSNFAWTVKRPELADQSSLELNVPIASIHDWNETHISARAVALAEIACRVWPRRSDSPAAPPPEPASETAQLPRAQEPDARCVHDLPVGQCSLCKPTSRAAAGPDSEVWVLPTSQVFHRRSCYVFDASAEGPECAASRLPTPRQFRCRKLWPSGSVPARSAPRTFGDSRQSGSRGLLKCIRYRCELEKRCLQVLRRTRGR
jgi:hypothetical protein